MAKIMGGQFIDLADLLPDNIQAQEIEPQAFLEGKLAQTSSTFIPDLPLPWQLHLVQQHLSSSRALGILSFDSIHIGSSVSISLL